MTDPRAGTGRPPVDEPDDRDLDDGGLDLTPRTGPAPRARRSGSQRWLAVGVLVVLALAVGLIVKQFLGDSTLYFKNADEAVAERAELGQKRFRLQGTVVGKPERGEGSEPTLFTVSYGGVTVDVEHTGSEPALFKAGLPVVAEGRWSTDGDVFESDRLLVKHTEDYKADHEERLDGDDSNDAALAPARTPATSRSIPRPAAP